MTCLLLRMQEGSLQHSISSRVLAGLSSCGSLQNLARSGVCAAVICIVQGLARVYDWLLLLPHMHCLNRMGIASGQSPTQEQSRSVSLLFVRSQSLQYTRLPMRIPVLS